MSSIINYFRWNSSYSKDYWVGFDVVYVCLGYTVFTARIILSGDLRNDTRSLWLGFTLYLCNLKILHIISWLLTYFVL